MRVIVAAITYNNLDTIRFWLRHYERFADEIAVFDDKSTDGTREILAAHPLVNLRDWPGTSGIREDEFLKFWYRLYLSAAQHGFDWMMIADPDEFLYAPGIRDMLAREKENGTEVIQSSGFNMAGKGLPKDDGRQIWEIHPWGVRAPVYSKPVIFNPRIHIEWVRGKHTLENCNPKLSDGPKVKLLHYRYMGSEYTRLRNAKNYERLGADKGAGWSCAPEYDGVDKEHSPAWADAIIPKSFNVLEAPL